jgi:periplasmic mercuric ion binding protein
MKSSVAFANSKTVKITVKGMVCGFCAQGIIKKFKAEPSVEKVDVSLEKQLVTLSLKEGQDIKDEKIKEIVRYAGYDLDKIEHAK